MTGDAAAVAVVGAGAAGLMAATFAARAGARPVAMLDGARKPGAKILVAGGGRCNVTHERVDASDFSGSTPAAIRKVLARFTVEEVVAFFAARGVRLKCEPGGKVFPVTDRARDVLDALLGAASEAGAILRAGQRVDSVAAEGDGFLLGGPWGRLRAHRVVLATGGASLPRSGSDGNGFVLARALGHTTTPRIFPALVPLLLPEADPLRTLAGVSLPAALDVRSASGRRMYRAEGSLLFTHFGVSGPVVLDASRHVLDARADDPLAQVAVSFLPGESAESVDAALRGLGSRTVRRWLRERVPERLAALIADRVEIDPARTGHALSRPSRRALALALTEWPLAVTGHRGFAHAETTAGGVPLAEVRTSTMESRVRRGLFLCGEILDVDGRIGGFNFQWAWASGSLAGRSAGASARPA